ncbi:MAG: histidinol phosphate phosphatase domain-containing protein [Dissulfurispiraceae bacterium]|jgi:histidinol phosphatase-like PHP family hydrolase|nr:histidinol phosphate phosphatase domain-containing protein [Dissulfurispiraceae bacterium]
MIDLHTHTIFSDGELIPSELIRRASAKGYRALAITDHMDQSNLDFALPRILKAIQKMKTYLPIPVIAGAELTHVPPAMIPELIREARALGAGIVIVHGETIVEPVAEGTNHAAIEGGADILAHPGLISKEDVMLAKNRGVCLEITARRGHSISNGHVARLALDCGAKMVLNTDSHSPSDLITRSFGEKVLLSAGIPAEVIENIFMNSAELVKKTAN